MKLLFLSALLFMICSLVSAQTQISPKYSVDGEVKTLAHYGDTLIAGGDFNNVGVYTGGGALFTTTSDEPILSFPKIIGSIKASTPDGLGGYYVFGEFTAEATNLNTYSPPRLAHILADHTIDPNFSLPVNALFGVTTILYHDGLLYIGGSYVSTINGQAAGDLAIINVTTKVQEAWTPVITSSYLGGVTGLFISQNTLYITGGFTEVGGLPRKNIAAIQLATGVVKGWDFASQFTNTYRYTDIKFYKEKMVISGTFTTGGTPQQMQHACAKTDTTSGMSIEYIFKSGGLFGNGIDYLYFAADVNTMALSGDTLFTFSTATFDTRVTAINLADSNRALWGKYFNMIAGATKMEVVDGNLYVVGSHFSEIYKSGFTNQDTADIERKIQGAVKLNTTTGSLQNWYPDPVADATVNTMSVTGNDIFIGGQFTHVKSQVRRGLLMLKAASQEVLPFNVMLSGHSIRDLKISDTTLYAAGSILYINNIYQPKSLLAISLNSGAILPWNTVYFGTVSTIALNQLHIFIGGDLQEPSGGTGRKHLFAINRKTGDLTNWDPKPNAGVSALHLAYGKLYVGGSFTSIADSARNYLAAFDTLSTGLSIWNPSPNWTVNSINASYGMIWIGGSFYQIKGTNCAHFAGINALTGSVMHKPITNYLGGTVNHILVKGCSVIIGGTNLRINAADTCNNLFVYNMFDRAFAPSSAFCQNINDLTGSVKALTLIDSTLYFGGNFIKVNGKANATHIERIVFPANYFNGCAQYFTAQNGNWHNAATWLLNQVPPENARVSIKHEVIVNAAASCFSASLESGAKLQVSTGAALKIVN